MGEPDAKGRFAHLLHLPRICSPSAAATSVPAVSLPKGLWEGWEAIAIATLTDER